eukprot:3348944-Amphidinium_carterae.1
MRRLDFRNDRLVGSHASLLPLSRDRLEHGFCRAEARIMRDYESEMISKICEVLCTMLLIFGWCPIPPLAVPPLAGGRN